MQAQPRDADFEYANLIIYLPSTASAVLFKGHLNRTLSARDHDFCPAVFDVKAEHFVRQPRKYFHVVRWKSSANQPSACIRIRNEYFFPIVTIEFHRGVRKRGMIENENSALPTELGV
jgi:hypothetical protein